jgi:hypothetical protein
MFERGYVVLPEPLARACDVALPVRSNKWPEFAARECRLNFVHEGLSFRGSGSRQLVKPRG